MRGSSSRKCSPVSTWKKSRLETRRRFRRRHHGPHGSSRQPWPSSLRSWPGTRWLRRRPPPRATTGDCRSHSRTTASSSIAFSEARSDRWRFRRTEIVSSTSAREKRPTRPVFGCAISTTSSPDRSPVPRVEPGPPSPTTVNGSCTSAARLASRRSRRWEEHRSPSPRPNPYAVRAGNSPIAFSTSPT